MSLAIEIENDGPDLALSAVVPERRITALLGPSGSGKTSILRVIAGLLRARRARVALGDEVWDGDGVHVPTRARPIAMVPQNYGLFPHLTARGNVEAALWQLGRQARGERALECLRLVQVEALEARHPRQLSGGQRQRVALARAIARKPQVLLLDEPFSAVDRSTRRQLYTEIRRLREQLGVTIVLVTHDLDEAAQLASHLVLLEHGRVLQAGPTAEVLRRPSCEGAARLLDIPNVLRAQAEETQEGVATWLRWGANRLRSADPVPVWRDGDVRFAVLPQNVLLPAPGEEGAAGGQNEVAVTIVEIVDLGGGAVVWLEPVGLPGERVQMRLPARALRERGLEAGARLAVRIRPEDVVPLGPAAGAA